MIFENIKDLGSGPFEAMLSACEKPDKLMQINRGCDAVFRIRRLKLAILDEVSGGVRQTIILEALILL